MSESNEWFRFPHSLALASYLPITSSVRLLFAVLTNAEIVMLFNRSSLLLFGTVMTLVEPLKLSAWLTLPLTAVVPVSTPLRPLPTDQHKSMR